MQRPVGAVQCGCSGVAVGVIWGRATGEPAMAGAGNTGARCCKAAVFFVLMVVSPAPAQAGESASTAAQVTEKVDVRPVYGRRTRFSNTAEIVEWTHAPPPRTRPPRAASGSGIAAKSASSSSVYQGPRSASAGRVTSGFGLRADPFQGTSRMHNGLDLAAPTGTPVIASAGGRVSSAGWLNGYGNSVFVDHGDGVQTRYGHLNAITVAPGQPVTPGTVIGLVGSTGRSTGAHLHYEVRMHGRAVNPLGR